MDTNRYMRGYYSGVDGYGSWSQEKGRTVAKKRFMVCRGSVQLVIAKKHCGLYEHEQETVLKECAHMQK